MKAKSQSFKVGVYSIVYDTGKSETLYLNDAQHAALKRRKNYKTIVSKKLVCRVQIDLKIKL